MKFVQTTILASLGLGLASITPATAAVTAFATITVSERAGPSSYYPVVTVIPRGGAMTLYGCLSGGSWCDVSYAGARGWVPGSYTQAIYRTQRVLVPRYVAQIGVPVVGFSFDVYWNSHYRSRPFFAERFRYERNAHGPKSGMAVAVRNGDVKSAHRHQETIAAAGAKFKVGKRHRIETFAEATPKPGKGARPVIAAGTQGPGAQIDAGPKSRFAMTQRRGKPCKPNAQGNGACQF